MRYNVKAYKEVVEIDIDANSALEAKLKALELLPENNNYILKTKAVQPKVIVLNNKIAIVEG